MYKNPPLGFLMLFCHVFIDAPEKLPKFGAFSTLGTALLGMKKNYIETKEEKKMQDARW